MNRQARIVLALVLTLVPVLAATLLGLTTGEMKLAFQMSGVATLVVLPFAGIAIALYWPEAAPAPAPRAPVVEYPTDPRLRERLRTGTLSASNLEEARAREIAETALLHLSRTTDLPR